MHATPSALCKQHLRLMQATPSAYRLMQATPSAYASNTFGLCKQHLRLMQATPSAYARKNMRMNT